MKFLRATIILFIAFIFISAHMEQKVSDITVKVTGLTNNTGQLVISLHLSENGFPEENAYRQLYIPEFDSPVATIIFKDVPFGKGALSILHDENNSGEMDFNFVHYPKEGFGFYKDFKVVLRRPEFEEVSFDISKPKMEVELKMQY